MPPTRIYASFTADQNPKLGANDFRSVVSVTRSLAVQDYLSEFLNRAFTNTRLSEIQRFLKGPLVTDRTDELSTLMR